MPNPFEPPGSSKQASILKSRQDTKSYHMASVVVVLYGNEKIHAPFIPPLQITQPLQAVACFQAFVQCSMNFASST